MSFSDLYKLIAIITGLLICCLCVCLIDVCLIPANSQLTDFQILLTILISSFESELKYKPILKSNNKMPIKYQNIILYHEYCRILDNCDKIIVMFFFIAVHPS